MEIGRTAQRFWSKVVIEGECWLWKGYTDKDGYGRFRPVSGQTMKMAHRWSFEHFVQDLFPGEEVDHLCGVRNCVNPNHLEAVGRDENMKRARKTHCVNGHPRSGDNLYITPQGHRSCRECGRIAQRKYQAKKRERD